MFREYLKVRRFERIQKQFGYFEKLCSLLENCCKLTSRGKTSCAHGLHTCTVRVVRLIPDDSGFGLGNSGFDFGLSISVCGCTAACVTFVARGPTPR
jgi:hypothetical protein